MSNSVRPQLVTTANNVVEEKNDASRFVRQDRYPISDLRCFLKIDRVEYAVLNYSSFGLAIQSPQAFETKNGEIKGTLEIEGFTLANLHLRLVRQEPVVAGDGEYRVAFEILSEPLNVEKVALFPELKRMHLSLLAEKTRIDRLPVSFVSKVYHLRDLLQRLEAKIEAFQGSQNFLSRNQSEDFEETVIEVTGRAIYDLWQGLHSEFNEVLSGQSEEVVKECYQFFREQMKNLLYKSPFAHRTLTKPRGYAGDFEMMNLIYRKENIGETLFGRCVENAFLQHPEPQAVRNRVHYLAARVLKAVETTQAKKIKIMSVASGPAMEVQYLVQTLTQKELDMLDITLLDQDEGSLKHAQRQIRQAARAQDKNFDVKLCHRAIKEVINAGLPEKDFDLIYSAGLFDYFTDPVAHMAGKVLITHIKEDAELVIGNFDVSTPNRFGMSLVFDWNLIYRSKQDLQRLFTYPASSVSIEQEENGINLFCVLKRK